MDFVLGFNGRAVGTSRAHRRLKIKNPKKVFKNETLGVDDHVLMTRNNTYLLHVTCCIARMWRVAKPHTVWDSGSSFWFGHSGENNPPKSFLFSLERTFVVSIIYRAVLLKSYSKNHSHRNARNVAANVDRAGLEVDRGPRLRCNLPTSYNKWRHSISSHGAGFGCCGAYSQGCWIRNCRLICRDWRWVAYARANTVAVSFRRLFWC